MMGASDILALLEQRTCSASPAQNLWESSARHYVFLLQSLRVTVFPVEHTRLWTLVCVLFSGCTGSSLHFDSCR